MDDKPVLDYAGENVVKWRFSTDTIIALSILAGVVVMLIAVAVWNVLDPLI